MSVFQFIIASLACYRLTVLLARDAGPWDVFKRLRKVSQFLSCPFCVSIWVGANIEAWFIISGVFDTPAMTICLALGMSSIAIALDRILTSDYQA